MIRYAPKKRRLVKYKAVPVFCATCDHYWKMNYKEWYLKYHHNTTRVVKCTACTRGVITKNTLTIPKVTNCE